MRKLRASGAFAERPHVGGACLEPLVGTNIAPLIQGDTCLFEPDSDRIRHTSRCDENIAGLDVALTGSSTQREAQSLSRPATHLGNLGIEEKFDSLAAQDSLDFLGNISILAAHKLRPTLQNRHAAAEAAVGLCQLETDIAASEHNQMRWQVAELESLNVRQWPRRIEPGNLGNCRMRSDIDEDIVAGEHTDAAVIQLHLDRLWRDKPTRTHDQLGAACLVIL